MSKIYLTYSPKHAQRIHSHEGIVLQANMSFKTIPYTRVRTEPPTKEQLKTCFLVWSGDKELFQHRRTCYPPRGPKSYLFHQI